MTTEQHKPRNREKTLEERDWDKHAPAEPIDEELFRLADRVVMDLRMTMAEAKRLLEASYSGASVEVNNVSLPLGKHDRARIFGIIWPSVLEKLNYWEFHASRFVKLSKQIKKDLQSLRAQIDELQNLP